VEVVLASHKRIIGIGQTLATTLVDLDTRIAAYTYAFLVIRRLGRSQGRIKDLWA
jgi:hypothetical protein